MEKNIVYCDLSVTDKRIVSNKNLRITSTLISCVQTVETEPPNVIIIRFPCAETANRSELIELCSFLRKSSNTGMIPVVALIKYCHRALILLLKEAGIDYMEIWNGGGSLEEKINKITENLHNLLSPAKYLSQSCPYLIYEKYSDCDELVMCKAYMSRLVVNNLRLESLCSRRKHEACDYFIKPRFKS